MISSLQHSFFFFSRKFLVVSTFKKVQEINLFVSIPARQHKKTSLKLPCLFVFNPALHKLLSSFLICFQPSFTEASLKRPCMFSTELNTSFSQATMSVAFNRASHKLLSSLAICFRLSFIRASLQFWPSVVNRPSHTIFSQDTFFPNAIENLVLPPLHRRPRLHLLLLLLTTTSDSSSETTMIEALHKTHCYTLQKQNKKKRFGKHNPVSNRKLSPTSFDQVPQNSQLSFSRQCTPETHIPHLKKLSLSKLQLSFSRQWTPETHIPHLKKLSLPQNSQLSFSRQCTQKLLTLPTPKNTLSLSLSLSLSKVPTFFLSTMHPRNSHYPPRKIRSLSLCV